GCSYCRFRPQAGRRSHAIIRRNVLLSPLHHLSRNNVGRRNSESGGGNSGNAAYWIPDLILTRWLYFPRPEYSAAIAICVQPGSDALLPRSHSGCIPSRWWMARRLVCPDRARSAFRFFLLASMERDERHAGESSVSGCERKPDRAQPSST